MGVQGRRTPFTLGVLPSVRFPPLFTATAFVQVLNAEAMQAAGRPPPPPRPRHCPRFSRLLRRGVPGREAGQEPVGLVRPASRELSWPDRETCAVAVASQHREHVPEPGAATMGISDAPRPLPEAGGHVGTELPLELFRLHQGGIRNLTL